MFPKRTRVVCGVRCSGATEKDALEQRASQAEEEMARGAGSLAVHAVNQTGREEPAPGAVCGTGTGEADRTAVDLSSAPQ